MKCPNCSHENDENAQYCNKCGSKFEKKQDWNNIFILAYCVSILFWAITYLLLKFIFDWVDCPWQTQNYIYLSLSIISALLTFVLPLGIRTTWMKIAAFVVIAIAAITNIFRNIHAMIEIANS